MENKTNQKKAADPYTKEEICHDVQKCVDELDGIMTDLHDIIVEGRKLGADGTKEEKEKMVEVLKIDRSIEIPIHHEILQTMRDEMDGYQKDNNLEIINYCATIGGKKLIRYLFVPCNEHGE